MLTIRQLQLMVLKASEDNGIDINNTQAYKLARSVRLQMDEMDRLGAVGHEVTRFVQRSRGPRAKARTS